MGLHKDRLIFDPADMADSDQIGSYVIGADGTVISHTTVSGKEGLDINVINASIAVTATDLDVRDITHATDSIKVGDGTDFLAINADGSINTVLAGGVADDAADSGNPVKTGTRALSGALSAVSANNDRADMVSDLYRRLYVNDSPNIGLAATSVTVGATEALLPGATLNGRRRIMVQNISNNDVYVGPTGVTTSSGLRVGKGATLEIPLGHSLSLYGIAAGAGNEVRVFELA